MLQYKILMFLQEISNPILDYLFTTITDLGSESFYIISLTFIYWCVNKEIGFRFFLLVSISSYLNILAKDLFQTQRPINYKDIKSLYIESAPGYSFPSGHTQVTTTFWLYLMKVYKNRIILLIGWVAIILVGFSRLYLRVHWPVDVIGGFILGLLAVFLGDFLITRIYKTKISFSSSIILTLILPNIILFFTNTESYIKAVALICGGILGYLLEKRYINFSEKSSIPKQIIKYLIGILGLFIIKGGLKVIFPQIVLLQYIRYFIMGLWTTLVFPYIVNRMKLYN